MNTDIQIHHLGYIDPALARRKANRDLRLLRLEYAVDPTDPYTLFNLGVVHRRLGDSGAALTFLLSSLKNVQTWANWTRSLYGLTAHTLAQLARHDEALALLTEGARRFPDDTEIATRRAGLLAQVGETGAAEACLTQLLQSAAQDPGVPGHLAMQDRREARTLLGQIYCTQGRHRDAERVYQELLADHPLEIPGWVGLVYTYLGQGRMGNLDHIARQLEKCPSGTAYALVVRAIAHITRAELEPAGRLLEEAIAVAPGLVWARAVRSGWLQAVGAPLEERIAAEREILRMHPSNLQAAENLRQLLRLREEAKEPAQWFSFTA